MSPVAHRHSMTLKHGNWLAGLLAFAVFALISAGMAVAQSAGSGTAAAPAGGLQAGDVPKNAIIIGNGWRCRDGLALGDSGECEPVKAPLNAIVTGNQWVCMPGFRQDGETCERLMPPANAYVCLLYTSPSPRDGLLSRMPSSA